MTGVSYDKFIETSKYLENTDNAVSSSVKKLVEENDPFNKNN